MALRMTGFFFFLLFFGSSFCFFCANKTTDIDCNLNNGKCVKKVCTCTYGFSAVSGCNNVSVCFNIRYDNASVCHGQGKCVDQDYCECSNNGIIGEECDSFRFSLVEVVVYFLFSLFVAIFLSLVAVVYCLLLTWSHLKNKKIFASLKSSNEALKQDLLETKKEAKEEEKDDDDDEKKDDVKKEEKEILKEEKKEEKEEKKIQQVVILSKIKDNPEKKEENLKIEIPQKKTEEIKSQEESKDQKNEKKNTIKNEEKDDFDDKEFD